MRRARFADLEHFPATGHDRSMWETILRSIKREALNSPNLFNHVIRTFAPEQIRSDCDSQDPSCSLAVSNQGLETSLRDNRVLAECLGVPTGSQLSLHRRAFRNLIAVLDEDNDEKEEEDSSFFSSSADEED